MSTDGSLLLANILANPDCDTVRLVYADWLQENGEGERAEFIRWQIALHGIDALVATAEQKMLNIWCQRSLSKNYRSWLPPWYDAGDDLRGHGEFRRGFIESLRCSAECWLAHESAIYWHPSQDRPCPPTAHPIRKVTLTTYPTDEQRRQWGIRWSGPSARTFDLWPGVEFKIPRVNLDLGGTQTTVTVTTS